MSSQLNHRVRRDPPPSIVAVETDTKPFRVKEKTRRSPRKQRSSSSLVWITICLFLGSIFLWVLDNREDLIEYFSSDMDDDAVDDTESEEVDVEVQREAEEIEQGPPFRMLLGIFSMDGEEEKGRREKVRQSYLSLPRYLEQNNITNISMRHSRICALHEYVNDDIEDPEECQLLYTFVVGGATEGDAPYENLDPDSRPLIMDADPEEPDVVRLNIQENMNLGKTPTWLKYASTEVPEEINVIAKLDSDTLVYPEFLIRRIEKKSKRGDIIYGGTLVRRVQNDCFPYMQGGFYFLHRTLAKTITTPSELRSDVIRKYSANDTYGERHEDVETGQLIHAFVGDEFVQLSFPKADLPWMHKLRKGSLKKDENFKAGWEEYIKKLKKKRHH